MPKNKLNLHTYGIHPLNPYKTVVSHLMGPRAITLVSLVFSKFPKIASRLGEFWEDFENTSEINLLLPYIYLFIT